MHANCKSHECRAGTEERSCVYSMYRERRQREEEENMLRIKFVKVV